MSEEPVVTLFRPVGPQELELLAKSGFRRWPARLPDQPIFYPVANEQYARKIAERVNAPQSGVGFVTRFQVRSSFIERYPSQRVGSKGHLEWWIPAEDLEELNDNIVGLIEVVGEFR